MQTGATRENWAISSELSVTKPVVPGLCIRGTKKVRLIMTRDNHLAREGRHHASYSLVSDCHHDALTQYQPCRVSMVHGYSTGMNAALAS